MESLIFDLRFAARSLRRRPTFTIVAIATIALSIGATTSIWSLVDAVLFRSLPYRDSGRLVAVWQTDTVRKKQPVLAASWDRLVLDYTDFLNWRAKQTAFAAIGVWSGGSERFQGTSEAQRVAAPHVSPGYLNVLNVRPFAGREFLPGEDVMGGPRLAMMSFETWQSRFGGHDMIDSIVRLTETPYRVVGILPAGFTLERGKPGPAFLLPAGQRQGDVGDHNRSFHAIGRLAPNVETDRAITETQQLLDAGGGPISHGVRIVNLVRDETRLVRMPLLILLASVGLLLLIACVNIAMLLLGEASTRDGEMGTRIALGASRSRLMRQLLTESVLLSVVGGLSGLLLAIAGVRALVAAAPANLPGADNMHVDGRIVVAGLAMATLTGFLFGLAPAAALSGATAARLVRSGGHSARGRGRLQRTMIATELALSFVLLVGAGLLVRSLNRLTSVDPGFRADHLLAVRVDLPDDMFDSLRLRAFYNETLDRLPRTPGIVAATAVSTLPFSGSSSSSPYLLDGEGDAERISHKHEVQQRIIPANFFTVMGIPVQAGRAFTADDRSDTPPVVIISEAAARRDFPSVTAVGQRVKYQGTWRTIVGVVADMKQKQLTTPDEPSLYTPSSQRLSAMTYLIRTREAPLAVVPAVRRVMHATGPSVVIANVDVMDDLIRRSFAEERFRTMLIGLFGVMAVTLAMVGMYGVTSRAVARRRHEIGIRVALGATSQRVVGMVARETLAGVSVGVGVGALVSFAATRVLSPYLFGVSANDPATYAGALALLAAISLAASWLPARRAGRVAPAVVLRGD